MTTLFEKLLSSLEVKHTRKYANSLYNEHPYKYTMYGLSQMLSRYNIKNEALSLEDKNELLKLHVPFIAEAANDLVIVQSISEKNVVYEWYDESINLEFVKFKDICTGVVLLAYPDVNSVELDYKKHFHKDLIEKTENGIIGLSFFVIITLLFFLNKVFSSSSNLANIILNVIGAYTSYLIIQKSFRIENKVTDRLCSIFKKQSCNNILETPAAKLFGRYSWGQIGLAYFMVNITITLLSPAFAYKFCPIFSVCALLYPIWSIWYQGFKAKSWCPLCLFVQFVLIVQGILNVRVLSLTTYTLMNITSFKILLLPLCYVAATLAACKISELYVKANEADDLRSKFLLLKYRKEIIEKMFESKTKYNNTASASRIVFGSEDSPYKITIFSNPYCNPCAIMHKKIEELYLAGCQIQYVFTSFSKDLSTINKYMIAAYEQYGAKQTWKLLSAWYGGGKSKQEKFFNDDLNIDTPFVKEEFYRHEEWSKETKFNATPTILFNGKELPDIYTTQDILFIANNGL